MSQRPYYRDVWACGMSNSRYPGAFPTDFIDKVRRKWWGQRRLWLFSGSFVDPNGVMIDCKSNAVVKPTVQSDCTMLPFLDESFDFILADPPYSEEEADRLYGVPYFSIVALMEEMIRVCRPGGAILLLHRLIPEYWPSKKRSFDLIYLEGVVGVFTMRGISNIRALTAWRKTGRLLI